MDRECSVRNLPIDTVYPCRFKRSKNYNIIILFFSIYRLIHYSDHSLWNQLCLMSIGKQMNIFFIDIHIYIYIYIACLDLS